LASRALERGQAAPGQFWSLRKPSNWRNWADRRLGIPERGTDGRGAVAAHCPTRVSAGSNRRWPRYERCVDGAPLNSDEADPDISRADFMFCMTAITWGWGVAQTADRLKMEDAKIQKSSRALR
jgi:hypothetical protein